MKKSVLVLLSTLVVSTASIPKENSAKGIYEVVIQNLSKIRVNLTSISNGNISVYGRMCG